MLSNYTSKKRFPEVQFNTRKASRTKDANSAYRHLT